MIKKINNTFGIILVIMIVYFVGIKSIKLDFVKAYEIKGLPTVCEGITLGGFSDLFYKNGFLYAITDRGPNTENFVKDNKTYRIFPCGKFIPKLVKFKLEGNTAKVVEVRNFKGISGLPISEEKDCIPANKNHKPLGFDLNGADTESFIIDNDGNYWVSDEYYPSIMKFDKDLNLIKRFAPENSDIKNPSITYNLPEIYKKANKNRGFEAMIYDGKNTIYVFLQSPLKDDKHLKILAFDIKSEKPVEILDYTFEKKSILSGATLLNNDSLLVAEKLYDLHFISKIDIKQSLLKGKPVRPLKDINEINKFTKIEGITSNGNNKIYIINDNDFAQDNKNRKDSFIAEFNIR